MTFFRPLRVVYTKGHIPALDGFRGIAILLVLIYHLFPYLTGVTIGWVGVDLFFVLSGILITGILLDSKNDKNYFLNYAGKRVLRIFPLYYLFLFLFFVLVPLLFHSLIDKATGFEYLKENEKWYWLYLQNWNAFFDPNYPGKNFLSHFWSLAIEEQFYVIWPVAVYYLGRKNLLGLCGWVVAVSLSLRMLFFFKGFDAGLFYIFTPSRLDGLAVGSSIAIMIRDHKMVTVLNFLTVPLLAVCSLLLALIVFVHGSLSFSTPLFSTVGYTVLAIFFGCLIITAFSGGRKNIVKSLTSMRMFRFFGKYSYGLYIYHLPVYVLLADYLRSVLSSEVLVSIICLVVSLAIAQLSYNLYEVQFLKLKSRFHSSAIA